MWSEFNLKKIALSLSNSMNYFRLTWYFLLPWIDINKSSFLQQVVSPSNSHPELSWTNVSSYYSVCPARGRVRQRGRRVEAGEPHAGRGRALPAALGRRGEPALRLLSLLHVCQHHRAQPFPQVSTFCRF